jgi:hypothetical protein
MAVRCFSLSLPRNKVDPLAENFRVTALGDADWRYTKSIDQPVADIGLPQIRRLASVCWLQ